VVIKRLGAVMIKQFALLHRGSGTVPVASSGGVHAYVLIKLR
jgi:hypothetical protein